MSAVGRRLDSLAFRRDPTLLLARRPAVPIRLGSGGMYALLAIFAAISGALQFVGASHGEPTGVQTGLLIVAFGTVASIGAWLVRRDRADVAAALVATATVVLALAVTTVHPDPGAGIILPIIAFVVALPHVRGTPMVAFAGLCLGVVGVIGLTTARMRAGPFGEVAIDVVVGSLSMTAIVMLMTWRLVRSRERLVDRLTKFVEGVPVGIFKANAAGVLTEVNGSLVRLLGYGDRGALLGMVATDLIAQPMPQGALADAIEESGARVGELELRRADGTVLWVRYHVRTEVDASGAIVAYEGILEDVSSDRLARDATARLVAWKQERAEILDRLRRLAPGRTVEDTADAIVTELTRGEELHYAAILELRNGNGATVLADRTGRRRAAAGTPVAAKFAAELRARATDGPWVEDVSSRRAQPGYRRLAGVGISQLALVPIESGGSIVGLLLAGTSSPDLDLSDRLHTLGEFATHAAALIGPALTARHERELLRDRIREVIRDGAFKPVFQAIVDLETQAVLGYEALTRFDDGTPPDRMFADAASCGMGVDLEIATIRAALDAAEPLPANHFVDLNVSPDLVLAEEPLRTFLRERGFNIVIELTEHTAIDDYGEVRAAIASLGPNVQLAVDDAGAGFASLRHITELRPQFVKLDRGLISGIDDDLIRQAMVTGMVHFTESVGSTLIAEGVETEHERWTLLGLGVKAAQGYLFGRPVAAELVRT